MVIVKIMAALLAAAAAAPPALAERSLFSLAVQGGLAGQEENNLRPAPEAGVGLGLNLGRGISLNGDVAFWQSRSRTSFRKLHEGTLTVSPLSISLRWELRPNAYFIPYLLAGGSYVFASHRLSAEAAAAGGRVEQRVESGTAFHLGLGARVPLTWRMSFFGEAAYVMRRAPGQTLTWEANQPVRRDDIWVNLHIVLLKFGLRVNL
ncbi:MAG: hypothetical protein FJY82_00905 [Candidatus Aminicenantes bacterium]|nr:hypothetical protein [Candidatus Aminicenantes bacterium]